MERGGEFAVGVEVELVNVAFGIDAPIGAAGEHGLCSLSLWLAVEEGWGKQGLKEMWLGCEAIGLRYRAKNTSPLQYLKVVYPIMYRQGGHPRSSTHE